MKYIIPILLILIVLPNSAIAKSKYTKNFIRHFHQCRAFSESKYNMEYNSKDTYQIAGFARDGSGKCIYIETNEWLRGKYTTTCQFDTKQHMEYYNAMLNPNQKTSVLIRGMAFVDANEKAVYLKYYNNPQVCTTKQTK